MHPRKSPFCRQFSPRFLACLFKLGLDSAARASMLALRTGVKIIDFLWHSSFATTSLFLFLPSLLFSVPGYYEPWGKDADVRWAPPKAKQEIHLSVMAHAMEKVIWFHQNIISPVDGPRSHFFPCSSRYMKMAMTQHGFIQGFLMGCDRLLRENKDPWVYRNVIIDNKLVKYDPPR